MLLMSRVIQWRCTRRRGLGDRSLWSRLGLLLRRMLVVAARGLFGARGRRVALGCHDARSYHSFCAFLHLSNSVKGNNLLKPGPLAVHPRFSTLLASL